MTINTRIIDTKNGKKARVTSDGALVVSVIDPTTTLIDELYNTKNKYNFFSAYLGSSGADSGNTSENVNGSSTSQEFYIASHNEYDIYIKKIIIFIEDGTVSIANFGGLSDLSVGWDLYVKEDGNMTYIINKAKTGGDVFAQTGTDQTFGDGNNLNKIINIHGGADANLFTFDFDKYISGGYRIARGSENKIISKVNDNLTGLSDFTVRVFGYITNPLIG